MVAFAPVQRADPYLRIFYKQIGTDSFPALPDEVQLGDCLWIESTIDGASCGGFLLIPTLGGHEANTLLTPPARGRVAIAEAKAAIALFRTVFPKRSLTACTYSGMRAAQLFITAVGFRRTHEVNEHETRGGKPCTAIYYSHG